MPCLRFFDPALRHDWQTFGSSQMALKTRCYRMRLSVILVVILHEATCFSLLNPFGNENIRTSFASFLPRNSGLFMRPFHPEPHQNESLQEMSFVSFSDAGGVLISLEHFRDFVPLPRSDLNNSTRILINFYEISGYLIHEEITSDFPIVQALFHAQSISNENTFDSHFCIEVIVSKSEDVVTSSCYIGSLTQACLANITLPDRWWSSVPLSSTVSSALSPPRRDDTAEVSFLAYSHSSAKCSKYGQDPNPSSFSSTGTTSGRSGIKKLHLENTFTNLGKLTLIRSNFDVSYETNSKDLEIYICTPRAPVMPGHRFRVLVKLRPDSLLKKFSIRAKTKSGLKILGIETHFPWHTDLEVSARRQVAEVVAFKTDLEHIDQTQAVFDWLFEMDSLEQGADRSPMKMSFVTEYMDLVDQSEMIGDVDGKINIRIQVAESPAEKLVLILQTHEVINVAPITGESQMYSMHVYAVLGGGMFADVTELSHCSSSDERVLWVLDSCRTYLTRGSETRGSTGVVIQVKYGGLETFAVVKVWLLEIPLEVELSDNKLSLMSGWKVLLFDPDTFSNKKESIRGASSPHVPLSCQVRYQSSMIDLYARFIAHEPAPTVSSVNFMTVSYASSNKTDKNMPEVISSNFERIRGLIAKQNTSKFSNYYQDGIAIDAGHHHLPITYLLHRKASFKVTHLLKNFVRSSDPSIVKVDATRRDGILVAEGIKPGKTEIQVFSNFGHIIGTRDIRVAMDKVTLDHIEGHVISDIHLQVSPMSDFPGAQVAKIQKTVNMGRRHQESLLEVTVGFDDDTSLPLKLIHPDDYVLTVETLDNTVAEVVHSKYDFPKLVAKGSGSGDLVSLALGPSRFCPVLRPRPLATGHAHVDVNIPQDDLLTQNDAGHFFGFPSKDIIELDVETVKKVNYKFDKSRPKGSKFDTKFIFSDGDSSKPNHLKKGSKGELSQDIQLRPIASQSSLPTSSSNVLQVTMYVLLGIFGLAVAIFVVNCFLYALNGRKAKMANIFTPKNSSIKEVQDWVWIDKKTLERNAVNTKCTRALMSPDEFSRASKASSSCSSSSGGNGGCRLSSATDFSSEVSCLSSSAGGKGMGLYRGSECSVRIGGIAMPPDDNGNTLPHDHNNTRCTASCRHLPFKNTNDYTSPLAEQVQADSDVEMADSFRCVPLEGQSSTNNAFKINNQKQNSFDVNTPDPLTWKEDEMGMSYEQLMKYFDDLKESTA